MDTLTTAMGWAQTHHAEKSLQHKAAFANSVAYLVTGGSGGYGGPSLREHLVSWSLSGIDGAVEAISMGRESFTMIRTDGSLPIAGEWNLELAIAHCERLCFDPAEKYHNLLVQIMEREHCFDNDPKDLEVVQGKSV
jgi:hypothetical protein